jgi:hypothetical protein
VDFGSFVFVQSGGEVGDLGLLGEHERFMAEDGKRPSTALLICCNTSLSRQTFQWHIISKTFYAGTMIRLEKAEHRSSHHETLIPELLSMPP